MAIPKDKFLDLVNMDLTTTWYIFNSQLYQQTDGVAMGGPASSNTAKIYMQTLIHEQTVNSMALHLQKAKIFDEVYSTLKRTHLQSFFHRFILKIRTSGNEQ